MKTPKNKEVVKYFENAKEIESEMGAKVVIDKDTFKFLKQVKGLCSNWIHNGKYVFWSSDFGYAKILSYKEPKERKYKITKAQLEKLHRQGNDYTKFDIEYLFSEVFETKLVEFNKWVVTPDFPKWIVKYDKDNDSFYGLNINGECFHADLDNRNPNQICDVRYATEQEVTEALTKEAVNIFKNTQSIDNSNICSLGGVYKISDKLTYKYWPSNNMFTIDEVCVFKDGVWAIPVIPTITIQEAEAKLNCKII